MSNGKNTSGEMPSGINASGKNAIGKKCQMVKMPGVKMPDGKNTKKQPFFANFCVCNFHIRNFGTRSSRNLKLWSLTFLECQEFRNVGASEHARHKGYRFSKKICLLLGHVSFLFVRGTNSSVFTPILGPCVYPDNSRLVWKWRGLE